MAKFVCEVTDRSDGLKSTEVDLYDGVSMSDMLCVVDGAAYVALQVAEEVGCSCASYARFVAALTKVRELLRGTMKFSSVAEEVNAIRAEARH